MGKVFSDDLKAGMVLASDLVANGRMLLPAGATLQEGHLKTLRAWGIAEADIVGVGGVKSDKGPAMDIDPALLSRSQEYIEPFFATADLKHEAMGELFRLAIERTALQLGNGWRPPKPCRWDEVEQDLRAKKGAPRTLPRSVAGLFQGSVELASLPEVYIRIVEVLNEPTSSSEQIAEMVSRDSSLSAKLLKLVNSAFYGFPSKIDTISRAITMVGSRQLSTMAMGVALIRAFGDIPKELIDMEHFWRHSVACGVFSRLLASKKDGLSDEQLFVGGMLHDVGRLIMLKKLPLHYMQAMRLCSEKKIPLFDAEKEVIGFDHAMVGTELCKNWKLPPALQEMVAFHHRPARGSFALAPSLLHVANLLAQVFTPAPYAEVYIPALQEKAWDSLGLESAVLAPIVEQAGGQIDEIVYAFLG